jgi:hypothetical protein
MRVIDPLPVPWEVNASPMAAGSLSALCANSSATAQSLPNHVLLRLLGTISLANGYKLVNSAARPRFCRATYPSRPTRMIPNRAKNCRQPANLLFRSRMHTFAKEYDNGAFSASPRFTCRVRGNIIAALAAKLVIANKAVNDRPNAGGLTGHLMQLRHGLNPIYCGEFAAFGLEPCRSRGDMPTDEIPHETRIAPRTEISARGLTISICSLVSNHDKDRNAGKGQSLYCGRSIHCTSAASAADSAGDGGGWSRECVDTGSRGTLSRDLSKVEARRLRRQRSAAAEAHVLIAMFFAMPRCEPADQPSARLRVGASGAEILNIPCQRAGAPPLWPIGHLE